MKQIKPFHHFKGYQLGVVEEVERTVIEIIKNSDLPDTERENSICWEFKHSSGAIQFAKLLAQKRNLDENICAIALALHDIYAIQTGKYKNHARLGVPIAHKMLKNIYGLGGDDIELILTMIGEHSNKEIFGSDPYIELAKDADTLDCFLYRNAEDFYLTIKPLKVCKYYFKRYADLRTEFELPYYPRYECLDNFKPGWLLNLDQFNFEMLPSYLENLLPVKYDPTQKSSGIAVFYSSGFNGQINSFSVDSLQYSGKNIIIRKEITELVAQLKPDKKWLLVIWTPFNAFEITWGKEVDARLNSLSINILNPLLVPFVP